MKNIFLLPTNKSSRLYIHSVKGLLLNTVYHKDKGYNQNIYITSDEEIKEKDWFFVALTNKIGKCEDIICEKNIVLSHWCKKIILTTDQDLINDGVQAIPDEFLEWFVKNPSCEFIKVEQIRRLTPLGSHYRFEGYKIIIPKEEPNDFVDIVNEHFWDLIDIKQETLEEAAERLYPKNKCYQDGYPYDCLENERLSFLNGAKMQQERCYSEKDLISFYNFIKEKCDITNTSGYAEIHVKWFVEQFKKKTE